MNKFVQVKKELNAAERALESMKKAKSFEDFEDAWKVYLSSIEKCWKKTERVCQSDRSKFQPWQGKYINLRKKDMLLKYIKHARNVDQHSIQEIVEHIPGKYSFSIQEDVFIKSLKTDGDGRVSEYIGTAPPIITDTPPRIELLRIKNRGKWYNPLTQHLGDKLVSNDPITVSEKGLEFYKNFLDDAEKKF